MAHTHLMRSKLQEEYYALDKEHTRLVRARRWSEVAIVFARMMEITDALHGRRGS